jgi:hypothetical protein
MTSSSRSANCCDSGQDTCLVVHSLSTSSVVVSYQWLVAHRVKVLKTEFTSARSHHLHVADDKRHSPPTLAELSPVLSHTSPLDIASTELEMSDTSSGSYIPAGLQDVPTEVLLEHLLPALPVRDLARMARVNRQFNELCVSLSPL